MLPTEFKTWWEHAVVVMPSLADWLTKLDKHPDKSRDKTLQFWAKRLEQVGLTEAKDAIEKIAQDSPPKFNRDYEGIPFAITRITSTPTTMSPSTRHYVDGQETVKCLTCNDSGWVMAWDHKSVADMRAGTFGTKERTHLYKRGSCWCCRCFCEAGQRLPKSNLTFDPALHCPCDDNKSDDDIEALREFCNPHNQAKAMDNYDPSLAEF